NTTQLVFEQWDDSLRDVHIRVPYWVAGDVSVVVNGEVLSTDVVDGYLTISRQWQAGDVVEITLPMGLHMYEAKDNSDHVAFMYGPIVLAGALGNENYPENDILDDHLKLNNHPLID